MSVKIVTYRPLAPGPTLTVLGAVHGNERCGAQAIARMAADIDTGLVTLGRGILQLVPVTNPKAYREGVRFVDRNLNRHLYPKEEKQHYEDHLDPIVCEVLDRTDVLLDLHSYTSPGGPFIFLEPHNARELAYATSLGVADFAYGWKEAFGSGNARESQGTTEYARTKGALAVTLECGQHLNADAADIGYRAILLAMAHLEMLDAKCLAALRPAGHTPAARQRCVRMKNVYHRAAGAVFARPWRHFDPVARAEAMATLANGDVLAAPEDGFIVLPKDMAVTGEEWFFFGTGTALPA
ncbi:MAG: succinylglutamate desuccinylase [Betaproteobacteria bacterium]|nr:succinylglutamate desuccinylase [Betaproteobacteria bacterium]